MRDVIGQAIRDRYITKGKAVWALRVRSHTTKRESWIIGTQDLSTAKYDVSLAHRDIIDKLLLDTYEES